MTDERQVLEARLAEVGRVRRQAKADVDELPELIRRARAAKLTMQEIADLAGYHREYLYELLRRVQGL